MIGSPVPHDAQHGWNAKRYRLSCDQFAVQVTVVGGLILDMEVVRDGIDGYLYGYLSGPYTRLRDFAVKSGSMEETVLE